MRTAITTKTSIQVIQLNGYWFLFWTKTENDFCMILKNQCSCLVIYFWLLLHYLQIYHFNNRQTQHVFCLLKSWFKKLGYVFECKVTVIIFGNQDILKVWKIVWTFKVLWFLRLFWNVTTKWVSISFLKRFFLNSFFPSSLCWLILIYFFTKSTSQQDTFCSKGFWLCIIHQNPRRVFDFYDFQFWQLWPRRL